MWLVAVQLQSEKQRAPCQLQIFACNYGAPQKKKGCEGGIGVCFLFKTHLNLTLEW